jgi:hypothetical protein
VLQTEQGHTSSVEAQKCDSPAPVDDFFFAMLRASCCRAAATFHCINSRAACRALSSKAPNDSGLDSRKSGATDGWSQWQNDDTMMQSLNEEQVGAVATICFHRKMQVVDRDCSISVQTRSDEWESDHKRSGFTT